MDSNKTKSILRKLRLIVKIVSLDDKIVELALNDEVFSDFKDAGLCWYRQSIILTVFAMADMDGLFNHGGFISFFS
jgi:hypothetical protein